MWDVLIDEQRIAARVAALGTEIRDAFGDDPIMVIGVLKGSFVFMADLVRAIPGPVECEFLGVSSYVGTESSGAVQITHELRCDVAGRHLLLVEDIIDTGRTLDALQRALEARGPASFRVVALLDKPSRRTVQVQVDWTGFTIEDLFVVGYGLDLDQRYRNEPFIGVPRGTLDR